MVLCARVPGGAALPAGTDSPDLRLISWNITLKCPLRCAHCYVNAGEREAAGVSRQRRHMQSSTKSANWEDPW